MLHLPFNVADMLAAPKIYPQMKEARKKLEEALSACDARGKSYEICRIWQRRFERALRSEIPDWIGFAAFRCITDFNLPLNEEGHPAHFPNFPADGLHAEDCPRDVDDAEKCWRAYMQYFHPRENEEHTMYSGKLNMRGELLDYFARITDACEPVPGGQAGNILWLWLCIGARARTHLPYLYRALVDQPKRLPALGALEVLSFEGDEDILPVSKLSDVQGVRQDSDSDRVEAPSGGSMIVFKDGRRLIYQFGAARVLQMMDDTEMPWDYVQFVFEGKPLLQQPLKRHPGDLTWPALPFFCDCSIDERTLVVRLAGEKELSGAIVGKADFAVISGLDAIFYDRWLTRDPELQGRLLEVARGQMKTLAQCGIRLGMELSSTPKPEYARLIREMCQQGVIVTLGINGVDELPDVVGKYALDNGLPEFWLDPHTLPKVSASMDAHLHKEEDTSFEFLTYLRARKLAETMGVRTLYVHTLTLDIILRRDADPGALLHAQQGDMMGKGLVIAALLQRAYGDQWIEELHSKMPPAVKPEAMVGLARFAADFEKQQRPAGSKDRLLQSGYWLAPSSDQYSVAVVPVMWPSVSEHGVVKDLPKKMNPTGSGDMTFGAFFFLGGV